MWAMYYSTFFFLFAWDHIHVLASSVGTSLYIESQTKKVSMSGHNEYVIQKRKIIIYIDYSL